MEVYGVIYLLINGTNDKEYVGQTTRTVEERFKEHAKADSYIGNAIRAHGEDMFVIAILKVCYSKAELDKWERHMIRSRDTKCPNGYNLTDGGEGFVGLERTPEHNAKIAASLTGKSKTPEHCKKLAEASATLCGEKNSFFGKHHKGETCTILSVKKRNDSLFKNLLSEMEARNISYHRLAKLLGFTQSSVSRKMSGENNFTERDKVKLVEIFNKPIEYLLERSED